MIERRITKELTDWLEHGKDALLLTGARQIGKTYLIRELLRESGRHFVEFNFIDRPEIVELFEQATSAKDLLLRLSAAAGQELTAGETVFFLDEVQECKEIVTRIKFLVDEGSFRYILSGSLLGVELGDLRSAPVGYLRIVDMYPLDIEEFYHAIGISETITETIRECYDSLAKVDDFVHQKLIESFFLYLIVGGMPEAVDVYLRTNDINRVAEIHAKIIRLYKQDFTKYELRHKLKLIEIYDAIPGELNEKNKRFFINHLGKGKAYERIENDFLWLKNAGVALPVYNVTELASPLKINEKRNLFKLFLSDVGLLTSQYPSSVKLQILRREKGINNGALFENAAAQELAAKGFPLYYYNSKKQGELDVVVELDGKVVPIEIKSGKDYSRHSAMDNVLSNDTIGIETGYVFGTNNVEVDGKCVHLPVYMLMCLQEAVIEDGIYRIDLSGLM